MVERALNDYGFGNWMRVGGEMKIENPFSMFSDIAFALICNNTVGVSAQEPEVCWQQV